jgi:hypothetical protein
MMREKKEPDQQWSMTKKRQTRTNEDKRGQTRTNEDKRGQTRTKTNNPEFVLSFSPKKGQQLPTSYLSFVLSFVCKAQKKT